MRNTKQFVSLVFAVAISASLFAGKAAAMPTLDGAAPSQSIELCIAKVSERANYDGSSRVLHQVTTKKRRLTGHTISIDTLVFDANGEAVIREYASRCVVTDSRQAKEFHIAEKAG